MKKLLSFHEVISSIEDFSSDDGWLYIAEDGCWNKNSKCAIIDLDNFDEEEFAIANGLKEVLEIADVQDIIENFKETHESFSIEKLCEAIEYYYENDAFIDN